MLVACLVAKYDPQSWIERAKHLRAKATAATLETVRDNLSGWDSPTRPVTCHKVGLSGSGQLQPLDVYRSVQTHGPLSLDYTPQALNVAASNETKRPGAIVAAVL